MEEGNNFNDLSVFFFTWNKDQYRYAQKSSEKTEILKGHWPFKQWSDSDGYCDYLNIKKCNESNLIGLAWIKLVWKRAKAKMSVNNNILSE